MIEATYRRDWAWWTTDGAVCGSLVAKIRQHPAYPNAHAVRSDEEGLMGPFLIRLNDANAPIPLYFERLVVPPQEVNQA